MLTLFSFYMYNVHLYIHLNFFLQNIVTFKELKKHHVMKNICKYWA